MSINERQELQEKLAQANELLEGYQQAVQELTEMAEERKEGVSACEEEQKKQEMQEELDAVLQELAETQAAMRVIEAEKAAVETALLKLQ